VLTCQPVTRNATEPQPRRRRSDGERSRQAILTAATELATLDGLEGLSIARLAAHIGMSKSGLFAHFGSKAELQLATVQEAQEIYDREVTLPAREQPEGLARVLAMADRYLSYLDRGVFPGGCFFAAAAAEVDTRDGPVKDRVRDFLGAWRDEVVEQLRRAQERNEVPAERDPEQLAFEIDALLAAANEGMQLFGDRKAIERARAGIRERLA
jgi:AcrR family transcriptional regulator